MPNTNFCNVCVDPAGGDECPTKFSGETRKMSAFAFADNIAGGENAPDVAQYAAELMLLFGEAGFNFGDLAQKNEDDLGLGDLASMDLADLSLGDLATQDLADLSLGDLATKDKVGNIAQDTTTVASDPTTVIALANALQTKLNALLTALKAADVMVADT